VGHELGQEPCIVIHCQAVEHCGTGTRTGTLQCYTLSGSETLWDTNWDRNPALLYIVRL
jgi:hypothetical protein